MRWLSLQIDFSRPSQFSTLTNAGQPVGTKMRILRALPGGIEVDDALSISEQVEL